MRKHKKKWSTVLQNIYKNGQPYEKDVLISFSPHNRSKNPKDKVLRQGIWLYLENCIIILLKLYSGSDIYIQGIRSDRKSA